MTYLAWMKNHLSFVVSEKKCRYREVCHGVTINLEWQRQYLELYDQHQNFCLFQENCFSQLGFFLFFWSLSHCTSPHHKTVSYISLLRFKWFMTHSLIMACYTVIVISITWRVIFFAAICYEVWFSLLLTSVWVPSALMVIIFYIHWMRFIPISSI